MQMTAPWLVESANGSFKDAGLDELAAWANVAQFVSFSPARIQRFCRIAGVVPSEPFASPRAALEQLLKASVDGRVNLRSFRPDSPQGNEFIYGIERLEDAEAALWRLTDLGLFVIANETIDVNDGGVSGVAQGGAVEFAPGATPRVVETDKVTSLPFRLGMLVLSKVYGFVPELPDQRQWRVEFSVHPVRRGYKQTNTIIWEAERLEVDEFSVVPQWPNSFSAFIGDKIFGLLIAEALGFQIPRSVVICRAVAPFLIGQATGSDVKWLRTCPHVPEPGLFPTVRGWTDPFRLLKDDANERIAAVMIQDEVPPAFSGGLLTGGGDRPIIEGVAGFGDQLMLGRSAPGQLPSNLIWMLEQLHATAKTMCGSIRMEWVFDGTDIWVLQLQQEAAVSGGTTIVPGKVEHEVEFDVAQGLDQLRQLVARINRITTGIKLVGKVGLTSHVADVLRRHQITSRMVT
jgi:hypothetical protein